MHRSLLLASLFLFSSPCRAESGDAYFEKGKYGEALQAYEKEISSQTGEKRWRTVLRMASSEALLFRYGNAVTRILAEPLPGDKKWAIRFRLLRSELSREFLNQYGHAAPPDRTEENKDPLRKTPSEWKKEIAEAYSEIWKEKDLLSGWELKTEEDLFEIKKSDLDRYPTLYDYLLLRWTNFLRDEDLGEPLPALSILEKDFSSRYSAEDNGVLKLLALHDEALNQGGDARSEARENWWIKRLLLVEDTRIGLSRPENKIAQKIADKLEQKIPDLKSKSARSTAAYQAAAHRAMGSEWDKAVELCRRVEAKYADSPSATRCYELRTSIELPEITLVTRPLPPGEWRAEAKVRNLSKIYVSLYATSREELTQFGNARPTDFSALRMVNQEHLKKLMEKGTPLERQVLPVDGKKKYEEVLLKLTGKTLPSGFYVLALSDSERFTKDRTLLRGGAFYVSNLMIFGSGGYFGMKEWKKPTELRGKSYPSFHLYAVDAMSGAPVSNVELNLLGTTQWKPNSLSAKTNAQGTAELSTSIAEPSYYHQYDALGVQQKNVALLERGISLYYQEPSPVQIHVETDRAIFRPGQKVKFKVTVLRNHSNGYSLFEDASSIEIRANDANGKAFFNKRLKLSGWGSATGEMEIPAGRLLGHYSISAALKVGKGDFHGSASFQVEEYKRPEFEVTLAEPSSAWKYGQTGKIQGEVKYYFGGAVPTAPVGYRVFRETYIPWFCWWWHGRVQSGDRTELASGETQTDAQGNFRFDFPVQPPSDLPDMPSRYVVEVWARDTGGRTIKSERTYTAGARSFIFDVKFATQFFSAGKPGEIHVRTLTLNENPVAGKGRYEVFKLGAIPPKHEGVVTPGLERSLEEVLKDVPNGKSMASGKFTTQTSEPALIKVSAMDAGIYRLVLSADDPFGGILEQPLIFVVAPEKDSFAPPGMPALTLSEYAKYELGDKAEFLIGHPESQAGLFVEVWKGNQLLQKDWSPGGGIRRWSLNIRRPHRGGITLRWFGVSEYKVSSGQISVEVPWSDRELKISVNIPKKVKPGAAVKGELRVLGPEGASVRAEALLKVYDRSLDYYTKDAPPWVALLYPKSAVLPDAALPLRTGFVTSVFPDWSWFLKEHLGPNPSGGVELMPPLLKLQKSRLSHRVNYMSAMRAMPEEDAGVAGGAEMSAPQAKSRNMPGPGIADSESAPRTEFAETAWFSPQIEVHGGRASLSFTMPDQLTSWSLKGYALTRDGFRGVVGETLVTQKELMVRLEIPRFLRENDEAEIKAVIHNESDSRLKGEVSLAVEEDGRDALSKLGVKTPKLKFDVKAKDIQPLSFPVKLKSGLAHLKVRAVARAGSLGDAEERLLPILPSRERVVDAKLLVLEGTQSKSISAPHTPKKATIEASHLQVDPQVASVILTAIPHLMDSPYECMESALNQFVPLAVLGSVFKKYPELAAMAKRYPKRKTVTPPWEEKDPRRLTALMETPWLQQSEGNKSSFRLIDVLDAGVVETIKKSALKKLTSGQNSDGGWPWFPGGKSTAHMTLYILDGFLEALRHNVDVPKEPLEKAVEFVIAELGTPKLSEESVASRLYLSYLVTGFVGKLAAADSFLPTAKKWMDFADEHSDAMTPLGKAYAAHVYFRLNEKDKGELYLDRALSGSREDEISGVHWTPERISWLWYNNTLEKHAFFLRTLMQFRPKDPRVSGLVKWLLFNRKGNQWKSTRASAAAIYSLLDFMKAKGGLDRNEKFRIQWAGKTKQVELKPGDFIREPLRISVANPSPSSLSGEIKKQGSGLAFVSVTTLFSTEELLEPPKEGGMLAMERRFYRRQREGKEHKLSPLKPGDSVRVGDEVEVHLVIKSRSQFEYVHLKAPRGGGFEAETLLSGWTWDKLSRYEEPRDTLNNFFISWLPQGEYTLTYRMRATTSGVYRFGSAVLQSMYAPEMAAYSGGFLLSVAP